LNDIIAILSRDGLFDEKAVSHVRDALAEGKPLDEALRASSNGNGSYRSEPASLSSGSVSSGFSTAVIHAHWRGYDRRNWRFGPSPWRSRMARA